ncbi:MAG: AAA family ATPase [Rhodoferax sp.]|nr:AAA family ATPase [Rhodoferax sp.]
MPSSNKDNYKAFASKLDEAIKARNSQGATYTNEPPPHFADIPLIGGSTAAQINEKAVILTCGASLTPEPVQWLWTHWLALGKFHLLAGAPGQGKTTIAMAMAATITIGGRWPDGSRCDAGNVLIWSGEDDYKDTLLPRLIGAGANRNRVFFVDGTRIGNEVRPFDPANDTRTLLEAIKAIGGARLIVIDPVSTAIQGDSHKNSEVRRGLQPLVDLAETVGAAVLGITHLSKAGQGIDPAQRVIGSIAFTAVARVVMLAARVKGADGDDDKRILARGKSNIGPDSGGFEYHLAQVEALPGIEASRVEWGNAVEGTARELLTDPCADSDGGDEDHDDVVEMLKAELTADCWTDSALASKALFAAGFTKKQIWKGTKKLGVKRHKSGFGKDFKVHWRLPGGAGNDAYTDSFATDSPSDSTDSPFQKKESLESVGICGQVESLAATHEGDSGECW